ncbi:MAG: arsenate reductase ArsC [Candidatus Izemoplasmataceae bacterium]
MIKVLFVCVHNSARSQMGETFLNDLGKDYFMAESAGIEKGVLNPNVIKVMDELGYDISKNETNSVFEFYKKGKDYTFVIKVCDEINGQRCPIFPNALKEIYWNLPDPSAFSGTDEEILENTRILRDEIKKRVIKFIEDNKSFAENRIGR